MATKTFEIDWIDIKGYEGLYKISTDGQILGIKSNKTLKPDINQDGYCRVRLYKDKECKHYSVHRLVAQTFLPNPDNLPEVNHKDEDKTNNCVENLEWESASEVQRVLGYSRVISVTAVMVLERLLINLNGYINNN